ncbi:MAG TPA: S1 RNA-binding domain-containing protein, partial [Saprospiraceae bacterium]|nr:S1 RNA-binding domain-containing protein [Saprospiraceae bacterium]
MGPHNVKPDKSLKINLFYTMLFDDEKELPEEQETAEPTPEETSSVEETSNEVAAEEVPEVVAETEVVETEAAVAEAVEAEAAVVEAEAAAVVAEEAPAVVAETATEAATAVVAAEEEVVAEEEEEEVELPVFETHATGAAHDDFNWKMDKRGANAYSDSERAEMLKAYDKTLSSVVENEVIRGKVSAISGGDVVLDINYKSDGLIPLNEFRDTPDLKQGDEVEVYVESQEDSQGQLGLSRKKAKILRAWESIVDSFKNGTIIRGTVISKTKGGLIVDCGGLETFLPGSQIDIKPVIDYDQYVGKV